MIKEKDIYWAIEQMNKGYKTKLKGRDELFEIDINDTVICNNKNIKINNVFFLLSKDWEIVDEDKDWNLANKASIYEGEGNGETYQHEDIKKCRDLIIKDIKEQQSIQRTDTNYIFKIINKRFGDLK